MPHGGGHAGGGGGHGGGGGYHHYRGSSGYRGGSGGGGSPLITGVIILLAVILTILIAPVTVSYQKNGESLSLVLSPGDTRILSRSSTLCHGATLSGGSALGTVNSSMYFLSNTPTLRATNSFVISSEAFVGSLGDYQYWSFHLYPGSKYLVSACLSLGYSVQYSQGSYRFWIPGKVCTNRFDVFKGPEKFCNLFIGKHSFDKCHFRSIQSCACAFVRYWHYTAKLLQTVPDMIRATF